MGRAIDVPAWQTCLIARNWSERAADAVGPYPIACLAPDSDLGAGLQMLREMGMVSVTLVVDGLLGPPVGALQQAFTVARPFKTHYLVDMEGGRYQPSRHHRYEIRRAAQRGVEVSNVALADILEDWLALYDELIVLRRIAGVQRFPRASFEMLASCEGVSAVAAYVGSELVSCHLWVQYDRFVWSHLAASSARGYAHGAAYAVYDHSLRGFPNHLINLGGAAGLDDASDDGLARFKSGFSNRTCTSMLIGSVLDAESYRTLCAERGIAVGAEYFPAYRTPLRMGVGESLPNTAA